MSNIEKIRQEIELLRREIDDHNYYLDNSEQALGYSAALDDIEKFIDSLPDENNPEPYNPVYDEDYLNEKIAKATKSWEGVDVNKMLADCRGYEEKPSEDLREEIEMEWDSFNKHLAEYDGESEDVIWLNWNSFDDVASYFYKLGLNARKED